jgi:hypothetical protein
MRSSSSFLAFFVFGDRHSRIERSAVASDSPVRATSPYLLEALSCVCSFFCLLRLGRHGWELKNLQNVPTVPATVTHAPGSQIYDLLKDGEFRRREEMNMERVESMAGLKAAFEEWRSTKRHSREAVPADLLRRACQAARRHGSAAVARATKLDRRRLEGVGRQAPGKRAAGAPAPTFSRVSLAAPAAAAPFVEIETAMGLKLRFFTQTDEALALLSSLLPPGGAR